MKRPKMIMFDYDIYGAHSAGIFPVLYEDTTVEDPYRQENEGMQMDFPYLHIHNWKELVKVLRDIL